MRTLIITAHPSSKGFTHRIAKAYADAALAKGIDVQTINLYDKQYSQPFLAYEDLQDLTARRQELNAIQKMIAEANELVFVFPVWWYDTPAIMKNFLDQNFTSGFAFNYSSRGISPLFTGKTARLFSTSGGPSLIYKIGILPYAPAFRKSLTSCGVKIVSKKNFGGNHDLPLATHEQWLKEVKEVVGA